MKKNPNLWQRYFNKAVEYYKNAKTELKQIPIEGKIYKDEKAVRRAAGLCYCGILEAIKGFLTKKGIDVQKKLKSADAYRFLLSQHKEIDGKLLSCFEEAVKIVHVYACYWGGRDTEVVKTGFERAKFVIEKLTRVKL
jgi:hypothetical protein